MGSLYKNIQMGVYFPKHRNNQCFLHQNYLGIYIDYLREQKNIITKGLSIYRAAYT